MNITPFYSSNNRLIFLPGSHENEIKRRFINTCNAMLYGRSHGETFGLACGEFSICNKPIIANTDAKSRFHIELLGEDLIGHTSYDECYSILTNWDKNAITFKNIGYKKYSAEHVMSQFQELINTLIKK
jgi:hypothetical protein